MVFQDFSPFLKGGKSVWKLRTGSQGVVEPGRPYLFYLVIDEYFCNLKILLNHVIQLGSGQSMATQGDVNIETTSSGWVPNYYNFIRILVIYSLSTFFIIFL